MKRCLNCDKSFAAPDWTCPRCGFQPREGVVPLFAPELLVSEESFEPAAFDHLPDAEDGSFWFSARTRLVVHAIRRYFPRARTYFEVGCGTGYVLAGIAAAFPKLDVTGSDPYLAGLATASRRIPTASLIQLDARHVPFEAEFDLIGAFDVVEHVDEDELVLAELHRALRPGGGLVLTVPQHPSLWSAVDEFGKHKRRYGRGELEGKLESAAFEVVRSTSFVSLLLPLMWISRKRQPQFDENYDPLVEFRHTKRLRPVLEGVMTAERALIRSGLSLPLGGSLLAVARRPA